MTTLKRYSENSSAAEIESDTPCVEDVSECLIPVKGDNGVWDIKRMIKESSKGVISGECVRVKELLTGMKMMEKMWGNLKVYYIFIVQVICL